MSKNKLDSSELEKLRTLNKQVFDSMSKLGEVEFAIHNMGEKKKALLEDHKTARRYLQAEQKSLAEKYGEGRVDLDTGSVSAPENVNS